MICKQRWLVSITAKICHSETCHVKTKLPRKLLWNTNNEHLVFIHYYVINCLLSVTFLVFIRRKKNLGHLSQFKIQHKDFIEMLSVIFLLNLVGFFAGRQRFRGTSSAAMHPGSPRVPQADQVYQGQQDPWMMKGDRGDMAFQAPQGRWTHRTSHQFTLAALLSCCFMSAK